MDSSFGSLALSCRELVIVPHAHAAGDLGDSRGIRCTTTFAGLRAMLGGPAAAGCSLIGQGSVRQLSLWEEQRLFTHVQHTFGDGDPADLIAARRLGLDADAAKRLAQRMPERTGLVSQLEAYDAYRARHGLSDSVDVEERLLTRLKTGPLPPQLAHVVSVEVLNTCEPHGRALRWIEALAHRFKNVRLNMVYDVDKPDDTPYGERLLNLLERQPEFSAELVLDAHPLPNQKISHNGMRWRAVRLAGGETSLEFIVTTLEAWRQMGVATGQMAVILPSDIPDGPGTSALHRGFHLRLNKALAAAGFGLATPLKKRVAETLAGRRLLNVIGLALQGYDGPSSSARLDVMHLADSVALSDGLGADETQPNLQTEPLGPEQTFTLQVLATRLRRVGPRRLSFRDIVQTWHQLDLFHQALVDKLEAWLKDHLVPLMFADLVPMSQTLLSRLPAWGADDSTIKATYEALSQLVVDARHATGWGLPPLRGPVALKAIQQALRYAEIDAVKQPGGVTVARADAVLGQSFDALLWLGGACQSSFDAPAGAVERLPDSLKNELRRVMPETLRYATVGADSAASDARAQWLWTHFAARCRKHMVVAVVEAGDEEADAPAEWLSMAMEREGICFDIPVPDFLAPQPLGGAHEKSNKQQMLRRWAFNHRNLSSAKLKACLSDQPSLDEHAWLVRRLWRAQKMSEGDHGFLHGGAQSHLRADMLEKSHSVRGLDVLGQCRFKYFASLGLGLEGAAPFVQQLDVRQQGTLSHRALERVFEFLLHQQPWSAWREDPDGARARAQRFLAQDRDSLVTKQNLHPSLIDALHAHLAHVVDIQLARDLGEAVEPWLFEVGFGGPTDRHPALILEHPTQKDKRLIIRGFIDRLERRPEGLFVVDYKTSLPKAEPGRNLQLALYQLAVFYSLREHSDQTGAAWVRLGGPLRGAGARCTPDALCGDSEIVLSQNQSDLWERVDPYLMGDVAPDPAPASLCRTCAYGPLCRKSDEANDFSHVTIENDDV